MRTATLLLALGLLAVAPAWAADTDEAKEPPSVITFPSSAGLVEFDHAAHVDEEEIECDMCHHETSASVLEVPHPDYFDGFWVDCATCHTGRPASDASRDCASCHPLRATGATVEMPSVKVAVHRSCWECHEAGTGADASAQCGFCHQQDKREPAPASDAGAAE